MSIAQRSAQTIWTGPLDPHLPVQPSDADDPAYGRGTLALPGSPLDGLTVSWAARVGDPGDQTNPEQLLAAAHSSCFSMALSLKLTEAHRPPEQVQAEATVTLGAVDGRPTVVSSLLFVRARVPGMDDDAFQKTVREAAELCPVSRLFAGARISVEALLEPQ